MKNILLLLSALFVGNLFGTPNIHEALKNPSQIKTLVFNGTPNEAALFMRNAAKFTSLHEIILSGISDSILVEQDIAAIAACSGVNKLSIENCDISNLSGAVRMLPAVEEVSISDCEKLQIESMFSVLAGMPALKSMNYSGEKFVQVPQSFIRMRSLEKIAIRNHDLSLADGYALNNSKPSDLFVTEKLQLGFGEASLFLEYSCYDKVAAKEHISIMRDVLQGAVGVNGTFRLPHKGIAFNRKHPLVKAPIPGLDVQKNIYSTSAERGGELEYPSGTIISIPENAFVDKNGNTITGSVTVDYREYRDQVDIMVSGIPMDYDSAGVNGHFISAGMFEMNASVNGQEVFLAPGKKVEMKFAVVDTADNFNFYRLDEQKGWVYENSPGKIERNDNAGQLAGVANDAKFSFAVKSFYEWSQRKNNWLDNYQGGKFDTLDFDGRYEDTSYFYSSGKKARRDFYEENAHITTNAFSLEKTYRHKGTMCFKIERMYGSGNNPEVSAFSGVHWKTTDDLSKREMKQLFREKSGIHDLRIYENGGSGFILEFKTSRGMKQIHAVPTYMKRGEPTEYVEKAQVNMFKRYTRMLNKRRVKFNKQIAANAEEAKSVTNFDKEILLDSAGYWKKLQAKMTGKEKAMDYDAWLGFYKTQLPELIKQNQPRDFAYIQVTEGSSGAGKMQAEALYQELKISGFGIYNCDHVGSLPAPIAMNAEFEVPGMQSPKASNVYVIDRDINTSTNFFNRGGNVVNITYNKGSKTSLIIIDHEGRLFYSDVDAFSSGEKMNSGNTRYPAKMITDQPASPQQIRDLISGTN